jgi:hypothetical protein
LASTTSVPALASPLSRTGCACRVATSTMLRRRKRGAGALRTYTRHSRSTVPRSHVERHSPWPLSRDSRASPAPLAGNRREAARPDAARQGPAGPAKSRAPGNRGPWSRDTPSRAIPEVLLDAHQQWTLARLMARRAKTLPPPRRKRMLKRARAMAHLASWQWTHPDDSQTAKTLCPPETLTEMGFSPAMVAALTRGPRPWCEAP